MTVLPEPTPTAPAAGQAANPLTDAVISAAVDKAIEDARRKGTSPKAVIGNATPVPQPGIPPMSSKAVDDAVRMLAAGAASLPIGGMTALVVHVLGTVDPAQLAIAGATPVALVLALARLLRRAKDVVPAEVHNHYEGTVYQDQREQRTESYGVWVKNNNQQ
ncbi:hypothetical protein ACH4UM_23815 [Streptomyces sp. NPDC020801]|uniref:hypothetical protein n=1 Tax=Streptomyces sp. NPDC020801 TaxID=3365093 RepID=UPI0037A6FC79